MSQVRELKSRQEFDELISTVPYVAIEAHASWCGPCKAIGPIFAAEAGKAAVDGKYVFAKFDTDEVDDLATELGIRSIPSFFFFENGDKADTTVGANPPVLKELIAKYTKAAESA